MTAMNKRTYSLDELAKHVNGEVQGDGNITISAVGTLWCSIAPNFVSNKS